MGWFIYLLVFVGGSAVDVGRCVLTGVQEWRLTQG